MVPIFNAVTVGTKKIIWWKEHLKKVVSLGSKIKTKLVVKVSSDHIDGYTGDDLIQGNKWWYYLWWETWW